MCFSIMSSIWYIHLNLQNNPQVTRLSLWHNWSVNLSRIQSVINWKLNKKFHIWNQKPKYDWNQATFHYLSNGAVSLRLSATGPHGDCCACLHCVIKLKQHAARAYLCDVHDFDGSQLSSLDMTSLRRAKKKNRKKPKLESQHISVLRLTNKPENIHTVNLYFYFSAHLPHQLVTALKPTN